MVKLGSFYNLEKFLKISQSNVRFYKSICSGRLISSTTTFLMRLSEHLKNASVPGLGRLGWWRGGLGTRDRTDVAHISNERSWYTDYGSRECFDVPSFFPFITKKNFFVQPNPKIYPKSKVSVNSQSISELVTSYSYIEEKK